MGVVDMEILSSRILVRPRNWEVSRRFYEEALGLAVARDFGAGVVYFLGTGYLELSRAGEDAVGEDAQRSGAGPTGQDAQRSGAGPTGQDAQRSGAGPTARDALWLQVRSLPSAVEEVRAAGVPVTREPRREPWGLDECWIADPDGRAIVLIEVPEGHPLRTDVRP